MIDHLNDAALDPLHVQREHPQHAVAQVADAGIGNQLFDVILGNGDQGTIHDTNDCKRHNDRNEIKGRLRKNREAETEKPVGSHLQKNAGQDYAARCRGLYVGIRQPGVKGKHGYFDGKCQKKS